MGSINVNWNQWAHEVTSDYWKVRDSSYSTAVFNDDGTVTVTYSKEGNVAYLGAIYSYPGTYQVQQVDGDIWYGSYMVNANEETQWCGEFASGVRSAIKKTFPANTWNRWSAFQTATERKKPFYFPYCETTTIGMTAQAKAPIWINLTQMYGAGNEPLTVEEFEHQCEINGINLNEYQPYTTGTIKSWRTSGEGALSTATTSGNIASFWSPTCADIKSCKVYFSPVQEGSGDPSPTNMRNINGWNGITVTHCGKNILDFEALLQHWNSGNTKIGDNSYNVRSTGTGYQQPFEFFKNDTTISMSGSVTDLQDAGRWRFELLNESGTRVGMLGTTSGNSFGMYQVLNVSANKYRLNFGTAGNGASFENIQVELGTECTSYEPYKGVDIPISWQSSAGTLYGGYIDLVSGELVAEWINIPVSIRNYDSTNTNTRTYRLNCDYYITDLKSNIFNKQSSSDTPNIAVLVKDILNPIWIKISIDDVPDTSVATAQKFLDDNGAIFVIKLRDSIHYSITPQQLTSFIGRNNIWSESGGNVEVEYDLYESADITLTKKKIYLSSPHIESKSGSVATFDTDMKAPLRESKINFAPKQSGTGTPSPDNVMPISGWDGLNVGHSGKNVGHIVGYSASSANSPTATRNLTNTYGTTINTTNPERSIIITQTNYSDEIINSYKNGYFVIIDDNLQFGKSYNASFTVDILDNPRDATLSNIALYTPSGSGAWYKSVDGNRIIFTNFAYKRNESKKEQHGLDIRVCGMSMIVSDICITPTSETDYSYEAYHGNEIQVSWQSSAGTLYGGYVDLVTGEVWKTWGFRHFTENDDWKYTSSTITTAPHRYYVTNVDTANQKYRPIISDKLGSDTNWQPALYKGNINNGGHFIWGAPPELSTVELAKEWIQSIGGIDVAYELVIPVLVTTLTPQQIKTLKGINNLWSDAGDVEVTYWTH